MTEKTTLPTVTRKDIVEGLRGLGLHRGDGVMVHSSLKSFGRVEGGAQTVIDALMETVTSDGAVMMPSFNHGGAFDEGQPGYYDPTETPTCNGAIPDLFWRLPGVYRSLNPTHPFAAWGRNAMPYVQFDHRVLTMGLGSPLALLYESDSYCLLLGATYESNTFHHVVEVLLDAHCLGLRTEAYPVRLPDGRMVMGRTWGWRERGCPYTRAERYVQVMRERGQERTTMIGNSKVVLFRLQDCFEAVAEMLRKGFDEVVPCAQCSIRPRKAPESVPSDWDKERGCLLPDSVAWTY